MSKYVYGIDLGTTYSCIAYQDETGRPVVVQNSEGTNTTPSVVQISDSGNEVIVGQVAKDNAVLSSANTIQMIKTKMGREKVVYYGKDLEKEIPPAEVSAYILKKIAQDAGVLLDDNVKDVVITCPAYFGDAERKATAQAGEIAGLHVIAILDEPTAAAIYYGCTRECEDKTVLVYDLGGGTFDVTVMRIDGGDIQVICTDGNHDLGGKDWDDAFYRYVKNQFYELTGYMGEFDDEAKQDLALKVERAKIQLTKKEKTIISLNVDNVRVGIEVSRDKFEELTESLLELTKILTMEVLQEAKKYGVEQIDEMLLVGGSTKMPQVIRMIQEQLSIEPKILEPDEAVAKGAAIFAFVKMEEVMKHGQRTDGVMDEYEFEKAASGLDELYDVEYEEIHMEDSYSMPTQSQAPSQVGYVAIHTKTTKSFGVKALKNDKVVISNIIYKNESTPITKSKVFGLAEDEQETANIEVYESTILEDSYEVDDECFIGNAILELPKGMRQGSVIEVTMNLSNEGTLSVTGKEVTTNQEVNATFASECILEEEEVKDSKRRVDSIVVI